METNLYPKFKFDCGCIFSAEEIRKLHRSHTNRFLCPNHPSGVLCNRITICKDCGIEFEIKNVGIMPERCLEHKKKHKNDYDLKYHKTYKKSGPNKTYKKGPMARSMQPPEHNIITDLQPNPVITNPNISPCLQGPCQLAAEPKNNTACLKCDYRSAYVGRVEGFYVPGIVITQHIPERLHILSVNHG